MGRGRFSLLVRALACPLLAALSALAFAAAMSLLPQSPAPCWLLWLAAGCGGGLAAWFCFAPPALRRARTFRGWGGRLAALLCAAVLCTLMLELFAFNHRAFTTRNLEPMEMPLDFCTAETGEYLSEDGGAIELIPDEEGVSRVYLTEVINEETFAIRCRVSGPKAPMKLTIRVEDEGSAYFYVEANHGYVVTDTDLAVFEGALYSNGLLYGLCLEFEPPQENGFYLESVELNPQIPVGWQPVRMALCGLLILLLLCMARFPWRNVVYNRQRAGHRLVILLPMLLLMLLNLTFSVLAQGKTQDGDLFRGVWRTVAPEAADSSDAYAQLFKAFQQGQLHILPQPSEELLSLENPYDTSERAKYYVEYYYDYALYDGKYYVYFGPAPVLALYYPCYWLTGRIPTEWLCALWLSLLSTPLIYSALLGLVAKYGRRPNLFLLSLSCFAVACVAGWPMLAVSGSRYYNAVACAVVMMAGALGAGLHAQCGKRGWQRAALFTLCGVFFALQGMSRANTLLLTTALLAPGFVGVLRSKAASPGQKARDAACFLVPALLGVGLVMGYNYARFGSVAEFGQLYQLTTEDIRYNVFRPEYAVQALWHNLLDFPTFSLPFPYVTPLFTDLNVTGNYLWRMPNVGVLSYPLLWLLPLMGTGLRLYPTDDRALRRERGFACLAPLACAAVLMVVSYYYAGFMERYTHDYLFVLALLAAFAGLSLSAGTSDRASPGRRAFDGVYAALCALSVLLCLLFGFSNERGLVIGRSPEFFYRLVRMFYPF